MSEENNLRPFENIDLLALAKDQESLDLLARLQGQTVLELGCGNIARSAITSELLFDKYGVRKYLGVDSGVRNFKSARVNLLSIDPSDFLSKWADDSVSILTSGWCASRFPFPTVLQEWAVEHIYRVTARGGLYICIASDNLARFAQKSFQQSHSDSHAGRLSIFSKDYLM